MRVAERATPVAAVIVALSTLACCLPLGFLGAMGLASLSVWAQSFRNWFIGGAGLLLVVGFVSLIGSDLSLEGRKNLGHQFQACDVIFHNKEFQRCQCVFPHLLAA